VEFAPPSDHEIMMRASAAVCKSGVHYDEGGFEPVKQFLDLLAVGGGELVVAAHPV
jgi:hypothetical protein